jgi:tRNA(adenine34) deaminase
MVSPMAATKLSLMARALELAQAAGAAGEVPVGAVIADRRGRVLAAERNRMVERRDPTAHAEMLAIRAACAALGEGRLAGCDIYVTLEPCAMCAAAISFARLARLYFGAYDPKGGGVEHGARVFAHSTCHHRPEVYGGIAEKRAGELLRRFFAERRAGSVTTAAGGPGTNFVQPGEKR